MMMTRSKEERIELVLFSGREGWSQTLCVFYHVPRLKEIRLETQYF